MKAVLSIAAALVLTGALPAPAQDGQCQRLAGQLAALKSGDRTALSRVRLFQDAIDRKNREYSRTLDYVRSTGCDVDPESSRECSTLMGNLQRLANNLESLEAQYQQLATGAGQDRESERYRLQALMEDYGCNGAAAIPAGRGPGAFEQLYNGPETTRDLPEYTPAPTDGGDLQDFNQPTDPRLQGTTLRTICVRKCDGFYFPISFATDSSRFSRDEATCKKQCSTDEAELFAYDAYRQQPEDAVSTSTGRSLRDMPNAFRFRTAYNRSCQCRPAISVEASLAPASEGLKRLDESALDSALAASKTKPAVPTATRAVPAKPSPPVDPGRVVETVTATGMKKIRVVGPAGMPAQ